jgi:hypothetical protein
MQALSIFASIAPGMLPGPATLLSTYRGVLAERIASVEIRSVTSPRCTSARSYSAGSERKFHAATLRNRAAGITLVPSSNPLLDGSVHEVFPFHSPFRNRESVGVSVVA